MKKIILFLIIATGAVGIACKKENIHEAKVNKLQGTWEATKEIYTFYQNDKEIEKEESIIQPKKEVYIFAGDSLLLYRNDRRTNDRVTFLLSGENLDLREANYTMHFKLKWYDDKQIGIAQEETEVNADGVKERYVQETVFVKK